MLVVGDNIKQVKEIGGFNQIEDVFNVTNIAEDGVITFKSGYGIGVMSYKEFEEHFERVEIAPQNISKNRKYEWTDWERCSLADDEDFHEEFESYRYKTNGVKVIVKDEYGVKSRSSCHPNDKFDLFKGVCLAIARMEKKIAENKIRELSK